MKIRKFIAADMQHALAEVRRELGPDAMIVATRPVRRGLLGNGMEVTAAIDVDEPQPAPSPAQNGLAEADVERIMAPLRSELRSLRAMLRENPVNELRGEIEAIRRLINELKAPSTEPNLAAVAASARLAAPPECRIMLLCGPTGVGKTTTIAKLATRAALIERRTVALVTLDDYRVGGEEQMRTFADLIGVPLHTLAEPERLSETLEALETVDRVFIDTAGRSPRDREALRTLEVALADRDDVEIHLTIAAGTSPAAIDGWLHRLDGIGVDRLLFTKLDEAIDLSELVRSPARLAKPISYVAHGQRIPEDLEEATDRRLLEWATQGPLATEAVA